MIEWSSQEPIPIIVTGHHLINRESTGRGGSVTETISEEFTTPERGISFPEDDDKKMR
jgi:hypothetical protein